METKNMSTKEKMIYYTKRYGYIAIIAIAAILIVTIILISALSGQKTNTPVANNDPITFFTPASNFTLAKDYTDKGLMKNETLKQWEAHKVVDLKVADGSSIFCVLNGTVTSVETDYLLGGIVTVDHGNGLVTKYASLSDEMLVKKGDKVSRGQKLGTATTTPGEEKMGARLQFSVFKNGTAVDPNNYLTLSNK